MSNQSKRATIDSILNDTMFSTSSDTNDTYTITLDSGQYNISYDNTITITSAAAQPSFSTGPSSYTTMSDEYTFNWGDAEEWVDSFPDWDRVQDMCKKYPGLEIALRNFKTVYTLVKDDYDNPKDEE